MWVKSMKILFVNKFLYPNGGSETYIFELGRQLQKMGHEVQYFGMEHEGRIVGNRVNSYTSNMDFHTGKLQKLLYPFKIIYSTEARKKIRLVLEDFKPDVVHLNNINFQITPSIIYEIRKYEKSRGTSVQIVSTAHDYQWVCPNHMMNIPSSGKNCELCVQGKYSNCAKNRCIHNSKIKSILGAAESYYYHFRKTYGQVDAVICPSEFMKEQLANDSVLASRLCVLRNFITNEIAADKNDMKKTNKENEYVLYFGRYAKEKGIETLLEVCKQLPEISFVFAGNGPLEDKVNLVSNVKNVGFQNADNLKALIENAKFSIYPSEWYENCPFSIMESQMYGTPVIGSNIGGIPELIQAGKNGELFESGNAGELKEKIQSLWNDSDRLQRYAQECAGIKYDTVENYCKKLIEKYEE